MSYILILSQTLFAVLDVRSAVGELLRGLGSVFLLCNLSTEKVAGLRWVRKRIGRIDLPSESLIQRSHNVRPVEIFFLKQLTTCHRQILLDSDVLDNLLGFLCASKRTDGRQPVFHLRARAKDKMMMLG